MVIPFLVLELKCLVFPLAILAALATTERFPVPGVARYDAMLVFCLLVQWALVHRGMETLSELRAVCLFHLLGLALEIQRTSVGAWTYPAPGLLRFGRVPLFSGFMYAGVASYLLQAWRRFGLSFDRLPSAWARVALALASYLSFFVLSQARTALIATIVLAYVPTRVSFTVIERRLWMPLGLAFALIGGVVWVGENAGTFLGAWRYPSQEEGWRMVQASKAGAWLLLVVVGFTIVERFKAWEACA